MYFIFAESFLDYIKHIWEMIELIGENTFNLLLSFIEVIAYIPDVILTLYTGISFMPDLLYVAASGLIFMSVAYLFAGRA